MFMNKYKYLVGMSDWGIVINEDIAINADFKAEVETDIYEQIMKLQVSTSFMNSSINMQRSILIHELIHFTQKNIYFKEDRNFIEAVTRVFAPKGIIISSGPMPENSPESRMRPIIKKAMANRQTYAHIRTELQQEMK